MTGLIFYLYLLLSFIGLVKNMDTTKESFVLEAGPDTDIWRKPPSKDVWNGMHSFYPQNIATSGITG